MGTPNVLFVFATPPGTQWVPLTGNTPSSGFCTPSIGLVDDGGGDVQLESNDAPTNFDYKNKTVVIYPSKGAKLKVSKGRTPKFTFMAVDSSAPPSDTAYFLCGLALKPAAIRALAPGGTSFPEITVTTDKYGATTLTLKDDNKSTTLYEFWVMVQDANGDVGLIDPLISNQA